MTIYRIYARFEPGHPRMAGRHAAGHQFTRGAWRVTDCFPTRDYQPTQAVVKGLGDVGFYSTTPRAVGTLVNPFKVLKTYLASQRT